MSAPDEGTDDIDQVAVMAQVIFDGYHAMIGDGHRWTDEVVSEETREKYRAIADDAIDRIQWRRFALSLVEDAKTPKGHPADRIP